MSKYAQVPVPPIVPNNEEDEKEDMTTYVVYLATLDVPECLDGDGADFIYVCEKGQEPDDLDLEYWNEKITFTTGEIVKYKEEVNSEPSCCGGYCRYIEFEIGAPDDQEFMSDKKYCQYGSCYTPMFIGCDNYDEFDDHEKKVV